VRFEVTDQTQINSRVRAGLDAFGRIGSPGTRLPLRGAAEGAPVALRRDAERGVQMLAQQGGAAEAGLGGDAFDGQVAGLQEDPGAVDAPGDESLHRG
jgi:hypothetical protein